MHFPGGGPGYLQWHYRDEKIALWGSEGHGFDRASGDVSGIRRYHGYHD